MLGFLPVLCYGQLDTLEVSPPDTANYIPPGQEAIYTDEEDEDDAIVEKKETSYFLQKWAAGNIADSLQLRRLTDSTAAAMRNDEEFWYANWEFKKQKERELRSGKSFWSQPIVEVLFWILVIGGFLTFLALFLSNSNVKLFRSSREIKTVEVEEETDDIFAINYQREIDKAIRAGNYRQAIRFMFLNLLRDLSQKNIITYKQDKTNLDYLLQLHNTAWYDGFFKLARNYEYTWYGHFDVNDEKFNLIRTEFKNFENRLGRS